MITNKSYKQPRKKTVSTDKDDSRLLIRNNSSGKTVKQIP